MASRRDAAHIWVRDVPLGPGGAWSNAVVDDLLRAGRQWCVDLVREREGVAVARQLGQALVDEVLRATDVAVVMSQPRLQARQLGPTECRVRGQAIDAIVGVVGDEPVQQQKVPLGERSGTLRAIPTRGSQWSAGLRDRADATSSSAAR